MLLINLPTDLIHDVFLVLDNRRTLASFILTNCHVNTAFKANSNSILRHVFCNEIGMDIQVLPYAFASLKSQGDIDMPEESMYTDPDLQPQDYSTVLLTRYSFMALKESHYAVFKEGRTLWDTLTAEESRRFHIAAHLFTNYQALWRSFQGYGSGESDSDREGEIDEAEAGDAVVLQDVKTISACHSFLTNVTTDELFWMQDFRDFLLQDMDCVLNIPNNPTCFDLIRRCKYSVNWSDTACRHFLLSGSVTYFGNWRAAFAPTAVAPTHLQRTELWLTDAISRVLRDRGVKTKDKDKTGSSILVSKGLLVPTCEKCGQETREPFFNKTSEHNNSEVAPSLSSLPRSDLGKFASKWTHRSFPGEMATNSVEIARACRRVHGADNSASESAQVERLTVIREIVEHAEVQAAFSLATGKATEHGLVVPEDDDGHSKSNEASAKDTAAKRYTWSSDDVLCLSCFRVVFSGLYYAWWLEERQTDRVEAHKFLGGWCWWGNECQLQRKPDHATLRDHCCPRTKGVRRPIVRG